MNFAGIGALLVAAAVGLGAFGAHGLRGRLDAYSMDVWERAVFYHFIHALGILMTALFAKSGMISAASERWVSLLLLAGIVLFSGSLYVLALSGVRTLGAVTPFGGLAFITAWVVLAAGLFRAR